MKRAGRWLLRLTGLVLLLVLALLAPVGWTAVACRGTPVAQARMPIIAPEYRRAPAATYLTYPEWHIVFAYDDYAKVIETGDPHDFGYLRAIAGFWGALCDLTAEADRTGGAPETRQMVHVIGVSFTAEMLAKAAYEETLGRLATLLRGADRAESDRISADQAKDYARFLHQTPWYRYDFAADAAELAQAGGGLRNWERRLALGAEYAAKEAYAGVIAQAVAAVGPADLTIRSVLRGVAADELRALGDVTILSDGPQGVLVETPRYAAFTAILRGVAAAGGTVVEIAGNDTIMVTITGNSAPGALDLGRELAALPRQGYDDTRWLLEVPVPRLAELITALKADDAARLEHIFDY